MSKTKYVIDCLDCGPQEVERGWFFLYTNNKRECRSCPSCRHVIHEYRVLMVHPRMIWKRKDAA